MTLRISQLYFEYKYVPITLTDKDTIEFRDPPNFTIDELEAILAEAKAFREYRKSRMNHECGISPYQSETMKHISMLKHKPKVYSKEMLLESCDPDVPDKFKWSNGGKYEPFNPEQTLIPKVDKNDNNIKEVIQINEAHENKPQALMEVPAFETNGFSHHRCNTSQYWITTDGRIKIDPPEPYNVAIYTTVDEIKRLRAMDEKERQSVLRAYGEQTYLNKRYALRSFLRDIADDVFPPAEPSSVTIAHNTGKVPKMIMVWPVASEEHALESTVTPDPADDSADTPAPIAEEYGPEVTPTPKPEDPYVVKTRMSKKTADLWDKFAKPPEITNDANAGAYLS